MVPPPGEVVDADHHKRVIGNRVLPSHHPQQGITADRHHQPVGKAYSGPAAQRQAEMMDDMVQATRPARPGSENVRSKSLRKYPAAAQ